MFVNVNGATMLIPRAQTCWVDYRYYEALQHAVSRIAEQDQDSNITGWREVPEYPVSVFHIEDPIEEQAAA